MKGIAVQGMLVRMGLILMLIAAVPATGLCGDKADDLVSRIYVQSGMKKQCEEVPSMLSAGFEQASAGDPRLQALPKGQYEAADSLGLNYFQTMRLIILPQALKIVIPPTVGILVGAFKDTSLVVIIALYDILKTTQSVLSNPNWMGYSAEAYIFIALIYFVCCFAMSSYSRRLEKELHT